MAFIKYSIKTFVLLLVCSLQAYAQHAAETIPNFTFFKLNKSPFINKNLEPGKELFFIFFDASCEHCQHAIQALNQHYPELKNTAVYLITLDNQATINNFMNIYGKTLSNKNNVTVLQDLNNEFILKFGPRKYPSMFLYSPKKTLILYEDNEESMFRFFKQINSTVNAKN